MASKTGLQQVINTVNLADSLGQEEVSHLVVHMLPTEDYLSYSVGFASSYMCNLAIVEFVRRQKSELLTFLDAPDTFNMFGSLRGQLYERFALAALRAGGVFKKYLLGADVDAGGDVSFPACNDVLFDKN